jgi:hypothetical protein
MQGSGDRGAGLPPLAERVRRLTSGSGEGLKELEQENARRKRLVAELSLDKLVLKDIAAGNF